MYPYRSHIAPQLKRKYAIKHFLAFTTASKDALQAFLAFLVLTFAIAYFTSHILLYITGYYEHTTALPFTASLINRAI